VDCIVQLTGQLFANTQIPCSLWFLSKSRRGGNGYRKRTGEVLFIDGRKLGTLIPGSRKQKQLAAGELERIAATYREFKRLRTPESVPGFARAVASEEIRDHGYVLTPGRYVGSEDREDEMPFEEAFERLTSQLVEHFTESSKLQTAIERALATVRR
jgi:type I restriction enzyme M protein